MHPRAMIVAVAASIAAASASEAGRKIFSDQTCEVISADISPKVTMDVIDQWQFGTNDFGYPRAEAYVSFLYYDGQSLQILLKEGDKDRQKALVPIGGVPYYNEQSLVDEIADAAYYYYPREDDDHFQLLNAVIAYDPHSTLFTNYAVFISDKSAVKNGNAKWYQIQGTRLFSEDGSTEIPSDRLWFYTKEILLSIQHFVKCPDQPKQPAPVLPDPIQFTEQTDKDLREQREFFTQHGCMVDGSEIVYDDSIEDVKRVTQCHPALMHEVKRVCGDHYRSKHASNPRCLIHGSKKDFQWSQPRRSTILRSEPELWAVAILEDFEDQFSFGWLLWALLNSNEQFRGMMVILTVDDPDHCVYQDQRGGFYLRLDTDLSKAVLRYDFYEYDLAYPGTDRSKVPDAWIYSSWAARNCGLRLVSEYTFRPHSVPKLDFSVPKECSIQADIQSKGVSMDRVLQWRFGVANQGIRNALVCAVPFHWDASERALYSDNQICEKAEDSGYTLKNTAALILQNAGFGIHAKDTHLLEVSVDQVKSEMRAVFGVFIPRVNTEDQNKWHRVSFSSQVFCG